MISTSLFHFHLIPFRIPISEQEATTFKEVIISANIRYIKEAAIQEIAETIKLSNCEFEDHHKLIIGLFPKEVEKVKAYYTNKILLIVLKDLINNSISGNLRINVFLVSIFASQL